MKEQYVKLSDVNKLVNKFENINHLESGEICYRLTKLPIIEIEQPEYKVGKEYYGISEYEEIVIGDYCDDNKKDYVWEHIKGFMLANEGQVYDCISIHKTKQEAEQALKELNATKD